MKKRFGRKLISIVLVVSMLLTTVPMTVLSEKVVEEELYIKSVRLARADSAAEAKKILEAEGYIFLDANLNAGTGEDGIWLGYQTTSDPTEAIYDMKLMNMKGGFTLTSMEEALAAQETAFAEMAMDLNYLVEEFIEAYEEESVPAQKAYKALNFFRMVEDETELLEENGLGYHIVNGKMSMSRLTEMLLLCDSALVDSVVKIMTMGIQIRSGNWMEELSELGPYDADTKYCEEKDEDELKRRADQLLSVLKLYSQAYNAMDLSGLIPDELNDKFEPEYSSQNPAGHLPADDATAKKLDESRYKIYKVVFDELETYQYGSTSNLKEFFCSLENDGTAKKLYPLVSVLSDGEFAALSYGCFLDVASGASATLSDFDSYDEMYDSITKEVKSVYLYYGVDDVLRKGDTVIGFTEAANRHMASTGEMEFYEKESAAEDTWETGKNVAQIVAASGLALMGVAKITAGVSMAITAVATSMSAAKSAMLAGVIKVCTVIGGFYALLIAVAVVAVVALGFLIASVIIEEINSSIDWDDNPMPAYLYDVKEVTINQTSENDGIATEFVKRSVFTLYEAVTDKDGKVIDLNARSGDATQWIAMYVSYDRQGEEAKPIQAADLLVKTGNGETPEGYVPLTLFGKVIACDMNQWDEDDDVNGIYMFYKQDQTVSVDDGKTYYIYDVYLQTGESDSHCIELLKAAGYTPLNVNLSPALTDDDIVFSDHIYTYLGYKTTTNKSNAIRDIRIEYGPTKGQIQYGAATYADCGSNGQVTLYATKYSTAGTALLEGGLICVDDPDKVSAGYEPVCLMAGGPAVSLNADKNGRVQSTDHKTYLYFLPETTFTGGTKYLSDVTLLYIVRNAIADTIVKPTVAPQDIQNQFKAYKNLAGGRYEDRVMCYSTYNPYRAVYDVKAVVQEGYTDTFRIEGVGYVEFNRISCTYLPKGETQAQSFYLEYGKNAEVFADGEMNGTVYLTGNPQSGNAHKANSNAMNGVQPLLLSDIMCADPFQDESYAYQRPTIPNNYTAVPNLFSNSKEPAQIMFKKGNRKYEFYIAKAEEKKPYISSVYAIDKMTIFRNYGGYDSGIDSEDITESMMLSQLAGMGATNFCGEMFDIAAWEYDFSALKFGYQRTAAEDSALRDVFLYFNKFSTDNPPKELYRGTVKYTVICEIPYNLTAYDEAPKPGIYLYGTTNEKAGAPIVDFDVSSTPFYEGYETVRTKDGRSLWSEALKYVTAQAEAHPMGRAQSLYEGLMEFFSFSTGHQGAGQENGYFYMHIKRAGDDLRKQKPYVGEIYLTSDRYGNAHNVTWAKLYDELFDMGADACINLDLNEKAGGDVILMGYSYTADPNDAITDIWAYHEKSHPTTLKNDDGITYNLVKDLDLNKGAGGDYIYLYATENTSAGLPITALSAGYQAVEETGTITWVDGTQKMTYTSCVKRWDTDSYSDLNRKGGGKYIYLMFTSIQSGDVGTYTEPDYGEDMTFDRSPYSDVNAAGKYIGGLYVMDKNTILQEKIAAGTLPKGSTCDTITDAEVKDRLTAMGATTIIDTPIQVTGATYFENNKNKVYIGYSYTKKSRLAIRGIAIRTEILSLNEPADKIEIDGVSYMPVAEAAEDVTSLPRAINLIGVDNGQDLLVPKMYLYYSTTADNEPISDITIDSNPIKNGWLTAWSSNRKDPYVDISAQAKAQEELARADYMENGDTRYSVYSTALSYWMSDISAHFNPAEEDISYFYIHTNHYKGTTLEEEKPYIGEVFISVGDTSHAALTDLVQYGVDGYVNCDLNRDAGGQYVYLGYKRTEKATDALTDLVVYEGKEPAQNNRIDINGKSVKYTLAANVDLNSKAGGKWLYLYYSDSDDTGNPITDLSIAESVVSYLKCGVEQVTVKRADGRVMTTENIDLNKGAGGDYLYLVMHRETADGHFNLEQYKATHKDPSCGVDGHDTIYYTCLDCGTKLEKVTVLPATNKDHFDKDGDKNHKCDVCGMADITGHTEGAVQKKSVVKGTCSAEGSYHAVVYCAECNKKLRDTVLYTEIVPDNHKDGSDADHNCDYCGLKIEEHTAGKPVEEKRVEPTEKAAGSYNKVVYCTECKEKLSEETIILEKLEPALTASLFGSGSVIAVCSFAALAVAAAILVFILKKRKEK